MPGNQSIGEASPLRRHVGGRLALLFVAIVLFAGLAYNLHSSGAFTFDKPLLLQARELSASWLNPIVIGVSWAGHEGVTIFDVALVVALLARKYWREGGFAGVAMLGAGLLNKAVKPIFARPRPSLWPSITPEHSFSFPSGHAMGSMTLALVLILLLWHTRWRWPVVVLGAVFVWLVGASRIYLGVHYPSDVLGGWAAATTWVVAVYSVIFINTRQPWNRSLPPPMV